jgi:GT2 family glycosyltransferase
MPEKGKMEISVIIPSYNNKAYLKSCLQSVSHIKSVRFRTVIVDDASPSADVRNFLNQIAGGNRAHVLRNSNNVGFGRSINRAFSFLKENYPAIPWYLLLNQDTELVDDTIEEFLDWMNRHPQAGIAGPRLLNSDRTIQNSFYTYPTPLKKLFQMLKVKKWIKGKTRRRLMSKISYLPLFARQYLMNFENVQQPLKVPWITGACLFIRADMLKDIHGFDENFKMYAEDMDLCLRAHRNHWGVFYYPGLKVIHHGGLKPSSRSAYLVQMYFDSLEYFYRKHYTGLKKNCLLFLNKLEKQFELRKASQREND